MGGAPIRVRREMGFTRTEFVRLLPRVFGDVEPVIEGDRIRVESRGRIVEITLSGPRERPLGPSIHLPYLEVEITLSGYGRESAAGFLEHFDRQYWKGGG